MSKELVIGSNRHETKVAMLEEDQLVEVYFQRGNEYSLAGSIHKGRVTRVLPGMQSAFVDLGLERDTFLYVSDFFEENEDIDRVEEKPARGERRDRGYGRGGERAGEERAIEPPAVRTITTEVLAAEGGESVEDEGGMAAAELAPVADSGISGPNERTETERGFRGERRGRRSRRRRQRGRGFPENKYAQPGNVAQPMSTSEHEISAEVEEAERDVIILPGESLAKYRNVAEDEPLSEHAEGSEFAELGSGAEEGELSPEAVELAEEEVAEREAIEEEAEEIALTDKIFGHNDDLSPAAEEEKIEEVMEDQPAPEPGEEEEGPGGQDLLSADASTRVIAIRQREEMDVEQPRRSEFAVEDLQELREGGVNEADEFHALGTEDTAEPEEHEASESGGSGGTFEAAQRTQTAEVRERGGGYMHRVSGRM